MNYTREEFFAYFLTTLGLTYNGPVVRAESDHSEDSEHMETSDTEQDSDSEVCGSDVDEDDDDHDDDDAVDSDAETVIVEALDEVDDWEDSPSTYSPIHWEPADSSSYHDGDVGRLVLHNVCLSQ